MVGESGPFLCSHLFCSLDRARKFQISVFNDAYNLVSIPRFWKCFQYILCHELQRSDQWDHLLLPLVSCLCCLARTWPTYCRCSVKVICHVPKILMLSHCNTSLRKIWIRIFYQNRVSIKFWQEMILLFEPGIKHEWSWMQSSIQARRQLAENHSMKWYRMNIFWHGTLNWGNRQDGIVV